MIICIWTTGILAGAASAAYLFLIGLFTCGWYCKSRKAKSDGNIRVKQVSIIVAARDEEGYITDLLNDIVLQDYPADAIEIMVIDDHSHDGTSLAVQKFISGGFRKNIILLKSEEHGRSGKKEAIALGIEKARGEIILTTDADCRLGPGWISSLVSCFHEESVMMAFGPVSYDSGGGIGDRFQLLDFAGLVASGAGSARAGHPFLCNGANLAYRKAAFTKVHGFSGNESYRSGDDVFLLHKIKKAFGAGAIVFCKNHNALVRTYPVRGLSAFFRQRIRWGSKSRGYKDGFSIFTALAVFLFNLMILISLFAGIGDQRFLNLSGLMLSLKILIDFPLVLGMTNFTGNRVVMKWYVPFQLIYPVYIVVAGFGSFFGRKANLTSKLGFTGSAWRRRK